MNYNLTRKWRRESATTYVLVDAADKVIAYIAYGHAHWAGEIHAREGREAQIFTMMGSETARAKKMIEQSLETVSSTQSEVQLLQLAAASPMRPIDGHTADVDGLALFDVVRSPQLL